VELSDASVEMTFLLAVEVTFPLAVEVTFLLGGRDDVLPRERCSAACEVVPLRVAMGWRREQTAGPSTALRSAQDDKGYLSV
jgi:hypothetical protein